MRFYLFVKFFSATIGLIALRMLGGTVSIKLFFMFVAGYMIGDGLWWIIKRAYRFLINRKSPNKVE